MYYENYNVIINGKNKKEEQESRFFLPMMEPVAASLIAPLASWLIRPVASSLLNAITGKRVRRAGKGQEGGFLPLLALPLRIH